MKIKKERQEAGFHVKATGKLQNDLQKNHLYYGDMMTYSLNYF